MVDRVTQDLWVIVDLSHDETIEQRIPDDAEKSSETSAE